MISVAMTTYMGGEYVKKQIDSILNQTLAVDEIIICDDGSSDETCDIIANIADERIKLIQNETNLGYIENFHKAISLTSGDYIFLADQDDIWHPDKVKRIMETMALEGVSAVCSNFELIDSKDKVIDNRSDYQLDPYISKAPVGASRISTFRLAWGNVAQGCTYCFTKAVKDAYLEVHNCEVIHDHQIMFIASCMGNVLFLNEKLISYRIHSSNSVGFSKNNHRIKINKKMSKEPVMYRLLREINQVVKVRNLWIYKIMYYLRIPYMRAIFRRLVLGK